MARLKRRKDGTDYIVGTLKGGGICTWQVTPEGSSYLMSAGYAENAYLSPDVMDRLHRNGWLYTGGGGAGYVDPLQTPTGRRTTSLGSAAAKGGCCLGCALPMVVVACAAFGWALLLVA